MKKIIWFFLSMVLFANPVINEIYDNPVGGSSSIPGDDCNEFIELYNCSEESIDLAGWILEISGTDDVIQLFDDVSSFVDLDAILNSTVLPGNSFALILDPEYLDALNDQPFDIPANTIVLTLGNTTFGSSSITGSATIVLKNSEANPIDSMLFLGDISHGEGQSVERMDCNASILENWSAADLLISPTGNTAGTYNTVSEVPNDISLDSSYVEGLTFYVMVSNIGQDSPGTGTLAVYIDQNNNEIGEPEELVSSQDLSITGEEIISVPFSSPSDISYILGILAGDQQPANNFTKALYMPSISETPLLITEFMNKPSDLLPEWVEFYNNTSESVNLLGWSLGDGEDQKLIEDDLIVEAGQFLVLAENEIVFDDSCNAILYMMDSWETLNNTDDIIVLADPFGFFRIRLEYTDDFGCLDYDISQELLAVTDVYDDPNSWWCGRVVGGTPGCENSLWGISGHFELSTDKKSFDPVREKLTINYDVPLKSTIRIRLYNLKGSEIITIIDHDSPQTGQVEFDGKLKGGILPIGMYILLADSENESEKLSIAIVRENR